jgi:tRNA threonylcarbamoyladenosine biosynthesis protein TsaE
MEVIFTLDQIEQTAQQFLKTVAHKTVFAFDGEMGAGKTTLIQAICKALGVIDTVSSPTFSIINQYKTNSDGTIYHLDLYRLKGVEEAINAGVEDCLYSGNICFVEWPQIAPEIFSEETVHIYLESINTNTRKLKIKL